MGSLKFVPRPEVVDGHPHRLIQGAGKAVPADVMDGDIGALAVIFYPFRIRPLPGATGREIESMIFHYLFEAHHWSPGILSGSHRLLVSDQKAITRLLFVILSAAKNLSY